MGTHFVAWEVASRGDKINVLHLGRLDQEQGNLPLQRWFYTPILD
jgi:hypothetical protein